MITHWSAVLIPGGRSTPFFPETDFFSCEKEEKEEMEKK
jgi:hypothetical protein